MTLLRVHNACIRTDAVAVSWLNETLLATLSLPTSKIGVSQSEASKVPVKTQFVSVTHLPHPSETHSSQEVHPPTNIQSET